MASERTAAAFPEAFYVIGPHGRDSFYAARWEISASGILAVHRLDEDGVWIVCAVYPAGSWTIYENEL